MNATQRLKNNNSALAHLLNEYEVADFYQVSVGTVRRWRFGGQGPRWIKVSDALVRYRIEDLNEFLASRPQGGGRAA